jgi:hypothetical protein
VPERADHGGGIAGAEGDDLRFGWVDQTEREKVNTPAAIQPTNLACPEIFMASPPS